MHRVADKSPCWCSLDGRENQALKVKTNLGASSGASFERARGADGAKLVLDPRRAELGARVYLDEDKARALPALPEEEWRCARLQLGIAEGQELVGRLPAIAGLVPSAMSFDKGCYVGQEVVARLHHRGKPKRRFLALSWVLPALPPALPVRSLPAPPAPPCPLFKGSNRIGEIVASCRAILLAEIARDDEPPFQIGDEHGGLGRAVPIASCVVA